MKQTTLCYLEHGSQYLMLHRTKKKNDLNHDKWIGVGGKFEEGESPEDCMLREVREETGFTVTQWRYCGIVTFIHNIYEDELKLIAEPRPFFSLKLTYVYDKLKEAILDGKRL